MRTRIDWWDTKTIALRALVVMSFVLGFLISCLMSAYVFLYFVRGQFNAVSIGFVSVIIGIFYAGAIGWAFQSGYFNLSKPKRSSKSISGIPEDVEGE